MKEDNKNNLYEELPDSALENVSGGINIGDTDIVYPINYGYIKEIIAVDGDYQDVYVLGEDNRIDYCPRCARLLTNYQATITGVRGVLDGSTLYWVTRNCCGYKSSIIETAIVK